MTENCRGLDITDGVFIAYGYQPVMITGKLCEEEYRRVQKTGSCFTSDRSEREKICS